MRHGERHGEASRISVVRKLRKQLRHWLHEEQLLVRRVRRWARHVARWVWYSSAGALVMLALVFTAARLWLPTLVDQKAEIVDYLSQQSQRLISVDRLEAYWDGLNPGLRVYGFKVYATDTRRLAARLDEVRISLAWAPLLFGRFEINSLTLVQPALAFERSADGSVRVTGIGAIEGDVSPAGTEPWLFQQREVIVENGSVAWSDLASGDAPLFLSGVTLNLRNDGDRHRLGFQAEFPPELCHECRFIVDINGDPFAGDDWRGQVYVRAVGLDAAKLPSIVRDKLPAGVAGKFNAQLWSKWHRGRVYSVSGHLGVTGLRLPVDPWRRAVDVHEAHADLEWSGDRSRWRLDLGRLVLGLTGRPWSAGRLRLDHDPERSRLRVGHVDLRDLAGFVASGRGEDRLIEWLRGMKPAGRLDDVDLEISGDPAAPAGYVFAADVLGFESRAFGKLPGVRGVSGRLSLTRTGGEFVLHTDDTQVILPTLFTEPLAVRKASGRVEWGRHDGEWRVDGDNLRLSSADGRAWGGFRLILPDNAASPTLKLRFDFGDGQGAHAARYYPLILPPAVRDWLARSVLGGTVPSGHVIYDGALRDFPFRDGNGTFEVLFHVKDGKFAYLRDWPIITGIDADVLFRGSSLVVTGHGGSIRDLGVSRVVAEIKDLKPASGSGAVLHVAGRASGPVSETLAVLTESPTGKWSRLLAADVGGAGDGVLFLDITVPVREPEKLELAGVYEFRRAGLLLPRRVVVEKVRGSVEFTHDGPQGGRIDAHMLGGDVVVEFGTGDAAAPPGDIVVRAHGTLASDGLVPVLGTRLSGYLHGHAPWKAQAKFSTGVLRDASLESDLTEVAIDLPAPLEKPSGTPLALRVRTGPSRGQTDSYLLQLGRDIAGKLVFAQGTDGWTFSKGYIGVGRTDMRLPDDPGLHIGVHAAALDGDRWLQQFKDMTGADGAPAEYSGLGLVTRVTVGTDALALFGRDFGEAGLDMVRWPTEWHGEISGRAAEGSMVVTMTDDTPRGGRQPPVVHLRLDRLDLPERLPDRHRAMSVDPSSLPEVHLASPTFVAAGKSLGALDFHARPGEGGWRIESLRLRQPQTELVVSGDWRLSADGRQATALEARLTSADLSKALAGLGYDGELAGGTFEAQSKWSWAGAPADFSLTHLDGEIVATLRDGRLLPVKQGAARLLGIINLSSLTRYLKLDFSNVFGKGFAFDSITGQLTVEKGNAYTRNLSIKGPSATIAISGRIGLATEDVDLEVGVSPHLGAELPLAAGLLGTPAVGAAVALMQNLLKKPLEETTRVNYSVKGPWRDPDVLKVGRPVERPARAQ